MADMVTVQELENAKIDARTIGESVNENKIVTPRYGAPFKSMPMIAEEMQSIIGTIIAGGVPASIVLDESGKTQQHINSKTALFMPNNLSNIAPELQTFANSLNDGDTLIIPSGNYLMTSQALITKQINIDCKGVFKPTYVQNLAHLVFKADPDFTYNAFDFITSFEKGSIKLALKSAFIGSLSDYFAVITSTEVAMHRSGFSEDYYKNILIDIAKDDFTLRDPLPFTINDLTKATIKLVKKRRPVEHKGLVFDVQGTGISTVQNNCIEYRYVSNIKTSVSRVNQNKNGMFGSAFSLNQCYKLDFDDSNTTVDWVGAELTYNFLYWISSYCTFRQCGNNSRHITGESQKGIAGRHGYKMLIADCDVNGVDDHWGYDLTVLDSNIERGVSMVGGSVTIERCTGDIMFRQRSDPPYNDGTLTIKNCGYVRNLVRMLGHDNPVWVSKDYASRKSFDVINIDSITQIASAMPKTRTTESPKMILMRDPQLDETNVFRDTIMNISNIGIINDVSAIDPIFLIDCWNENDATPFKDYDKKRMFSKITIDGANVLFLNGANKWRSGTPPVCDTLTLKNCSNLDFFRYRAREVQIYDTDCADVGTGSERLFDCASLVLSNIGYANYSGSYKYAPLADRYYPTMDVNIYNSRLPSQSFMHNGFTNFAATTAGVTLKVAKGNSFKSYDLLASTNLDFIDIRDYDSKRILKTTMLIDTTIAAGAESAILSRDFDSVRQDSVVIGKFNTNKDLLITVLNGDTVAASINKVYFKVKNVSAGSITVPFNQPITFKIV